MQLYNNRAKIHLVSQLQWQWQLSRLLMLLQATTVNDVLSTLRPYCKKQFPYYVTNYNESFIIVSNNTQQKLFFFKIRLFSSIPLENVIHKVNLLLYLEK